jgi:tetratricopeptide (TPR) repeat protein
MGWKVSNKVKRFSLLFLLAAFGVGLVYTGEILSRWQSAQVAWYNFALEKAANPQSAEDLEEALKAFDQSVKAYEMQSQAHWFEKLIYPEPSKEYAALAHFQKGKLYIMAQQPQKAVESFKESLKINPGNIYEGEPSAYAYQLSEQAKIVKYNLELLFKKSPSMANGEGKGKGKGKPKPGDQPADQGNQPQPGQEAGHGTRDDI